MPDDPSTGATPGGGATPPQPGGQTPPPATPPATGDDLGDAGKRALQAERDARAAEKKRADELEAELTKIREATASESEKAIAQAKREAQAESDAKWKQRFVQAEVRGALRGAGIANDRFLAMALADTAFSGLAVDGDGNVTGVADAVEAFKTAVPEAFKAAEPQPPKGQPRQGVQPPPADATVAPGYDRLSRAYSELETAKK